MRDRIEAALGAARARHARIRFADVRFERIDLTRLETRTRTLGELAAAGTGAALAAGEAGLAEVAPVVEERTAVLKEDFRRVPLAAKRELVQSLEDEVLGLDPRVQDAVVSYRDSFRSVAYATTEGT